MGMQIYDKEVDNLLSQVEVILLKLAADYQLTGANIDRWRWDEPSIMLAWEDGDIGKSLHVTVEQNGMMGVDINAWKDFDDPGDRRRRQWVNNKFGPFKLDELSWKLVEPLKILCDWGEAELVNIAHLI